MRKGEENYSNFGFLQKYSGEPPHCTEQISLPEEAWATLDKIVATVTEDAPGTGPVFFGLVIFAGLIRFNDRLSIKESPATTIEKLLEELKNFESYSKSFPLGLGDLQDWQTKDLGFSIPCSYAWRIINPMKKLWMEPLNDKGENSATAYGNLMLFGLWSLKECLLRLGNPIAGIKEFIKLNELLIERLDDGWARFKLPYKFPPPAPARTPFTNQEAQNAIEIAKAMFQEHLQERLGTKATDLDYLFPLLDFYFDVFRADLGAEVGLLMIDLMEDTEWQAHLYYQIGWLASGSDQKDAANEYLARGLALRPVNKKTLFELHDRMAANLEYLDKYPEAEHHCRMAIEIGIEDDRRKGSALNSLGHVLLKQNDLVGAAKAYVESIRVYPEVNPRHVNYSLGWLEKLLKDHPGLPSQYPDILKELEACRKAVATAEKEQRKMVNKDSIEGDSKGQEEANPELRFLQRIQKAQLHRVLEISLPRDTWATFDEMVGEIMKYAPGTAPVVSGYVLLAGVRLFSDRLRGTDSSTEVIGDLLKDIDHYESSSESFSLGLKNLQDQQTRKLEVSMPDDCWRIFDSIVPLGNEGLTTEIFFGYFLLFGLWLLKKCMLRLSDPITSMKEFVIKLRT